jgi:signal transduction histidine kinase
MNWSSSKNWLIAPPKRSATCSLPCARSSLNRRGLTAAVQAMADKMMETFSQKVVVEIDERAPEQLEMGKQGVIFYIIEEAVNNARKHAAAEAITVKLNQMDTGVVLLEIIDNGVSGSMLKPFRILRQTRQQQSWHGQLARTRRTRERSAANRFFPGERHKSAGIYSSHRRSRRPHASSPQKK